MKDTAGNEIRTTIEMCPYCTLDTGGQHQSDCPFYGKPIIVCGER